MFLKIENGNENPGAYKNVMLCFILAMLIFGHTKCNFYVFCMQASILKIKLDKET